jgi:hypothetical protein
VENYWPFARILACGCWGIIKELKLGGVNHDKMRKWVKTMYMPESTYHREPSRHKEKWTPLKPVPKI